jgi:hypothetical protein
LPNFAPGGGLDAWLGMKTTKCVVKSPSLFRRRGIWRAARVSGHCCAPRARRSGAPAPQPPGHIARRGGGSQAARPPAATTAPRSPHKPTTAACLTTTDQLSATQPRVPSTGAPPAGHNHHRPPQPPSPATTTVLVGDVSAETPQTGVAILLVSAESPAGRRQIPSTRAGYELWRVSSTCRMGYVKVQRRGSAGDTQLRGNALVPQKPGIRAVPRTPANPGPRQTPTPPSTRLRKTPLARTPMGGHPPRVGWTFFKSAQLSRPRYLQELPPAMPRNENCAMMCAAGGGT